MIVQSHKNHSRPNTDVTAITHTTNCNKNTTGTGVGITGTDITDITGTDITDTDIIETIAIIGIGSGNTTGSTNTGVTETITGIMRGTDAKATITVIAVNL